MLCILPHVKFQATSCVGHRTTTSSGGNSEAAYSPQHWMRFPILLQQSRRDTDGQVLSLSALDRNAPLRRSIVSLQLLTIYEERSRYITDYEMHLQVFLT
jgi:hypothetical protein